MYYAHVAIAKATYMLQQFTVTIACVAISCVHKIHWQHPILKSTCMHVLWRLQKAAIKY